MTVGALVIALVAVMFAVQAAAQASRSRSQIAALQANVTGLRQRIAADERRAAGDRRQMRTVASQASTAQRSLSRIEWTLAGMPTETEVARLRGELAYYAACIPDLQRELDALAVDWRIDPGRPTADYFRLFTAAPIARSCADALTGR